MSRIFMMGWVLTAGMSVGAWGEMPGPKTAAAQGSQQTKSAVEVTGFSPAVVAAMKELSADDFAVREKAVANLEIALGQEMRTLLELNDPEAQARIGQMLTFEQGLSAWAKDVMKMPADKQKEIVAFGMRPEVLPAVAMMYAPEAPMRLEGVKALRKMD
ncbi:MAG TPA: hypothetical protein VGN88_08130, partial [Phycisphaerae bacterium]